MAGPQIGPVNEPMSAKRKTKATAPMPGTQQWKAMHCTVAVMVEGRRGDVAEYLRAVARSLDFGCTSGITGDANPCRGKWMSDR